MCRPTNIGYISQMELFAPENIFISLAEQGLKKSARTVVMVVVHSHHKLSCLIKPIHSRKNFEFNISLEDIICHNIRS